MKAAALAGVLALVSGTDRTEADDVERRWAPAPRLTLGPAGGLASGFQLRGALPLWPWSRGEGVVGVLQATRFWFLRDPRLPQPGVELRGADVTIDLAATFGHSFRFVKRRLHLGVHVYLGAALRSQRSALVDPAHGIDTTYRHNAAAIAFGNMISFGVRLGHRWGIELDALLPWVIGGQRTLGHRWLYSSPYVALTLAVYLGPSARRPGSAEPSRERPRSAP